MAMINVCRICVNQEADVIELFESTSQEIISMIQFCTGILKEDGAPSKICNKCLQELHIAHKFKLKCVDSEKALTASANIECLESERNCASLKSEDDIKSSPNNHLNPEFDHNVLYDDIFGEEAAADPITSTSDVKTKRRVAVKSSFKKTKKIVGGQVQVPPPETKVKARRALNKFKRLFCEQCQVSFKDRQESLEHKRRLHKEKKSWICEVCGKAYAHRSSQITHMHSHYPARYACHHCDYATHNKNDLVKHVRTHTGDKLYKCAQCACACRTSSNLRKHVRSVHERARPLRRHADAHDHIKRYVCEVCHSCFRRRYYWKKHLQKQHDIIIPSCRPGRKKTEVLLLESSDRKPK